MTRMGVGLTRVGQKHASTTPNVCVGAEVGKTTLLGRPIVLVFFRASFLQMATTF